jgi:hypothetical protein
MEEYFWKLFLICACLAAGAICAQSGADEEARIIGALEKGGFENLAVCQDDTQIIITYENRVYRYDVKALREVIDLTARIVNSRKELILLPQHRGIPVAAVHVDGDAVSDGLGIGEREGSRRPAIRVFLEVEPYWKKVRDRRLENRSRLKLDVELHPQVRAQFGTYSNAVESQINAAPSLSTLFWRGMSASAQWIIPLQNELGEEGDYLRPGLLTVNQTIRWPAGVFFSGTAGYFSEYRYGLDMEIRKYWGNGRWTTGLRAGYTGFAVYFKNVWNYSPVNRGTCFIDFGRRFSGINLTADVMFGRFVYADRGVRIDVSRQFGEVRVGFFGIRTNEGKNGGISFVLPVFPSKRPAPGRIRFSPAREFPWTYRYRGLPLYGIQYATGSGIGDFMEDFNPDFIQYRYSKESNR